MNNNERTLNLGFAQGLKQIEYAIFRSLHQAAEKLLFYTMIGREFTGFTGNTQTSYMCGVYMDGKLVECITQRNWPRPPVHGKIPKGKVVFLEYPYEGYHRAVKGQVHTDTLSGSDTSLEFLRRYRVPKGYFGLVMTTGTEYSELLEQVRNLDVLTNTYNVAYDKLQSSWKKI
jgi:hypothetical protein